MNRIFLGEAEVELFRVPQESVHLVVTSPPYYNAKPEYAEYEDVDGFFESMMNVFYEIQDKLVDGARVCINTATGYDRKNYVHLGSRWVNEMEMMEFKMRGEIIWNKGASVGSSTAWGCHDDKTEIKHVDKGWIPFSELEVGDDVVTFDPVQKHWIDTPVLDVIEYPYSGPMFNAADPEISFSVTPNHEMINGMSNYAWPKTPISEIDYSKRFRIPVTVGDRYGIGIHDMIPTSTMVQKYEGMVYCATVECGILWTRHNGKGMLSGNSWRSPSSPHIRDQHEAIYIFEWGGSKLAGDPERSTISKEDFMDSTRSVWDISATRDKRHPAVMPYEMACRLIHLYSYEGNTVLDPFSGSGTTLIAAQDLRREFIGIERDEDYHRYSLERMQAHSFL